MPDAVQIMGLQLVEYGWIFIFPDIEKDNILKTTSSLEIPAQLFCLRFLGSAVNPSEKKEDWHP